MNILESLWIVFVLAFLTPAWAHGEDKPGPHGGFIAMPGAFHVELVPVDARRLKVYLLDIHWKNPSVVNSAVELTNGVTAASCGVKADHYLCEFGSKVDLNKKGELRVTAVRENQKGNVVQYSLPLKMEARH